MATAPEPPTLIISTPKAGHVNQCIAFCEAAGWRVDETHRLPKAKELPLGLHRFLSRAQRQRLGRDIARRYREEPRLRVVASGASSEPVVRLLRRHFGKRLFAVFVGTPRLHEPLFDAAISSRHEIETGEREGETAAARTFWIDGCLVRRVGAAAPPDALHLTVLVGGANRTYALEPTPLTDQLRGMVEMLALGPSDVSLVFSRRTPQALAEALTAAFPGVSLVPASDRSGFERAYARASHLAVTPDSITMVCEACASGRPVGVFSLPSGNDESSAARFITAFRKAGHIAWGRLPAAGESLSPWNPETAARAVDEMSRAWLGAGIP